MLYELFFHRIGVKYIKILEYNSYLEIHINHRSSASKLGEHLNIHGEKVVYVKLLNTWIYHVPKSYKKLLDISQ